MITSFSAGIQTGNTEALVSTRNLLLVSVFRQEDYSFFESVDGDGHHQLDWSGRVTKRIGFKDGTSKFSGIKGVMQSTQHSRC